VTGATVEDVLFALEKSNLVPAALVARLRIEISKSPPPHDPRQLIKFLVDKGHVTAAQGERLLLAPKSVKTPEPPPKEPYINLDDDLGLAPLDEEPAPKKGAASVPAAPPPPPPPIPVAKQTAAPVAKPAPAPKPKPAPAQQNLAIEVVEEEVLDDGDLIEEKLEVLPDGPAAPTGKKKKGSGNVWDSQLLVLGGGGLVLMILVVGGILWSMLRTTGEQAFGFAKTDYEAGSYTQAIAKLDEYLANHSGHKDVSSAKVMRALATIRRSAEGTKNYTEALATAKTSLDEIDEEDAFVDARAELADLLTNIAEGLSNQAKEKPDPKLIEQSNEALSLVKQYVPSAMRNAQRLESITEDLEVTERNLARDSRLVETIAKVKEAAGKLSGLSGSEAAAQLAVAYDARKQLLKDYPALVSDTRLAEAIQAVSLSEMSAVAPLSETRDAVTEEAPNPVRSTLALAARPLAVTGDASAGVFIATLPGNLVGLNAASGEPLWRRATGVDSYLPAMSLSGSAAGDSLLADTARQELVRFETATGKLRWRLPVEEAFSTTPAVFGSELLLPTHSGKLLRIELESGRLIGGWQLPHALEVAPAVDVRRKLIYQLAAHSNLYVLSPDEPGCKEVLYLGHEASSILVAPTAVSRYLLVAENTGLKDGVLRVIQADENGLHLAIADSEAIGGHVDSAPLVDGRMLHVATDRGGLFVFEIGVPGSGKPLTRTAERVAALPEPRTHYPLVKDSRLWVAGAELARFSVQSSSGKLAPDGVSMNGSYFLQPPQLIGSNLLLVRRPADGRCVTAMAIPVSGRDPIWETTLAAPLVAGVTIAADGQTMQALDAAGNQFRVAPAELGRGGIGLSKSTVPQWPPTLSSGDLAALPLTEADGAQWWMVGAQPEKLLGVAPDGAAKWITLPEPATSRPQAFQSGIAIGGQEGRIYVIDPTRQANLLEPYQPKAAASESLKRFGPAVVDDDSLLVSDASGKLTVLSVKAEPKPHLEVEREVALDEPLALAPVTLGKSAFAVRESNSLAVIDLATLEVIKTAPLGGKPVWGPEVVGDKLFFVTAGNELCCWNGDGEELWKLPLAHGPLTGAPIRHGDEWILLTRSGGVVRVGAEGAELAHVATERPLFGRGAVVGQYVVAPGADGTLNLIALP
jgi:hypothetical protein